jgi:DNA mismatch repair protein MutL
MNPGDARAALEEILEKLKSGKTPDPAAARDEILHTVACKAAIKAGYNTDRAELVRIVEAVLSGKVKYCPHGRPVSAVLSRRELDRLFKRIV